MIEEFIKYTDSYKKYGEMIDLKINHTFRVKDLCIKISKSLELNEGEQELAALCGLLHDIGRFEQWKRYKSYKDLETVDHGDLGVEVLKNNNFITAFSKTNHDTILKAVKYHNKYRVPNTLSDKNKLFVNITRDADKLDILYLNSENKLSIKTEDSKMSSSVYNSLLNGNLIKKGSIKTKADLIAIRIGFIFDINYKITYRIIKEEGYIDKIIDNQLEDTNNKELKEQLIKLKEISRKYIEEMIL